MMSTNVDLAGWEIVILRSPEQAFALEQLITAHGGHASILPVLDIVPKEFPFAQLQDWTQKISQCEILMVVSSNAINCAPMALVDAIKHHPHLKVVTMGQATSAALQQKGIMAFLTAPIGSTSESLLTDPFFAPERIKGKTVGILAGEEGRTVLAETLAQRGAKIHGFKVYSSQCAQVAWDPLFTQWQTQEKVSFIVTSERILHCLLSSTPQAFVAWLLNRSLVVISQRLADFAKEKGFQQVFNASSTDPHQLLIALNYLKHTEY